MNYDTLFVFPNGRTARDQYIGALITLGAAFAFYYFLVAGRTSEWCQLTLLFPAVVLHARRLRDMGQNVWLLIVPAALLIATSWFHLFNPGGQGEVPVSWAALVVSAAFVLWGLVGKSKP